MPSLVTVFAVNEFLWRTDETKDTPHRTGARWQAQGQEELRRACPSLAAHGRQDDSSRCNQSQPQSRHRDHPMSRTPFTRGCMPRRQRGLTPRSSGAPTAGHQRPAGGTRYIFTARALASCRCRPLSSNVRLRKTRLRLAALASNSKVPTHRHGGTALGPDARAADREEHNRCAARTVDGSSLSISG